MERIPYSTQTITEDDISAVVAVLRSPLLTQGPLVSKFEENLAEKVGAKYATAVNSATSALHIACLSLGLGEGDLLWTSPISFVASANCALYCGAEVDFVDIDPDTLCMSSTGLALKLDQTKRAGGQMPKIVVPVHFGGQSCDMQEIRRLSKLYGFFVVEDASHALGARYKERYVGSCDFSDICIFSFHPVKIITTGEGGAITTNLESLDRTLKALRSHGVTRNPTEMTESPHGPWYYEQFTLGFNYRMTEFQAALGMSQLEKLDRFVASRRLICKVYEEKLVDTVRFQQVPEYTESARHLFPIRVDRHKRLSIYNLLLRAGIQVNVHYAPIYSQPYYRKSGKNYSRCLSSENYYAEAISIPVFPSLDELQLNHVVSSVREFVAKVNKEFE